MREEVEETTLRPARRRDQLNRAAVLVAQARTEAFVAFVSVETGDKDRKAARAAQEAQEAAEKALRLLLDLGATPPDAGEPIDPNPLRSLAALSTPAGAALLTALREVVIPLAERVDAERGHVLPAHLPRSPGESRGTGWAETLSELALRLKIEVEGPSRRGGRE